MQPVILHLDMNSYFASVIQQDHPQYRGRPLGVCEHLGGIIIGASKEAKRWGINTGTPVWEALKLYPKIILTHTAPERFRFYTRRLIKLVSDYTSEVEVYSIDEVFLDITRACNITNLKSKYRKPEQILNSKSEIANPDRIAPFEEAVRIALDIKKRMKNEVGDWLTCSIGIAENKILAKIASDLRKPDGLVVIIDKDDPCITQGSSLWIKKDELYYRLKLTDIPGIGLRQAKNLNLLGIYSLLDLKNCPKSHLIARFGRVQGYHLYHLGQLESTWKADVYQDNEIKSMGHMYTLPMEYRKPEFFAPVLYKLCEMVGRRLRRRRLEGNVLHFFANDGSHGVFGESQKLGDYIFDGRDIFRQAMKISDRLCRRGSRPSPTGEFRLIGVTMANLRPMSHQLSLFGHRERSQRLVQALDKINDKYGEFTVCRVPLLAAGKVFRDSVGFGRVKEL